MLALRNHALEKTVKKKRGVATENVPTALLKLAKLIQLTAAIFCFEKGLWISRSAFGYSSRPKVNPSSPSRYDNPRMAVQAQSAEFWDILEEKRFAPIGPYFATTEYVPDMVLYSIFICPPLH